MKENISNDKSQRECVTGEGSEGQVPIWDKKDPEGKPVLRDSIIRQKSLASGDGIQIVGKIGDKEYLLYVENHDGRGLFARGQEYGVYGSVSDGSGVVGVSGKGSGVVGYDSDSEYGIGVTGHSNSCKGYGVYAVSKGENGIALYADVDHKETAWAGWFSGKVRIDRDLEVLGALTKPSGSFKIDHPVDPENKYLSHSFVESQDMMNIYNGNIVTDANGEAEVVMPDYFGALNRDYRYQLTVVGQFAQAVVWRGIENNRFVIKTDNPNVEVSWQVTGIRHDPFANDHRVVVEEMKPESERGLYLYPEAYRQPEEKGIGRRARAAGKQGA